MENLNNNIFYALEKSIKMYRQFAQRQLVQNGFDITIDQWLVLKTLTENPEQTQNQIAEAVFKDYASVTRIIELLVEKQYLTRSVHSKDRRRFNLAPTERANNLLDTMQPIIDQNRKTALAGIDGEDARKLQLLLDRIKTNCQP